MANAPKIIERGTDGIALEAATPASQPGDIFPAGVVLSYAGSAAPTNWLICDGSVVSRATYPALFAAIGTTYGAGDGSTTFGIPDMRGRTVVGKHTSGTFVTLGGTGGEENHTLINGEMPVHGHGGGTGGQSADHSHSGTTGGDSGHTHSGNGNNYITDGTSANATHLWGSGVTATSIGGGQTGASSGHSHSFSSGGVSAGHNHAVSNDGGGATHNNMHPYMVLHHIIKAA